MTFDSPRAVPVAFTAPDTELAYRVTATATDGKGSARAQVRQRWGPSRGGQDIPGNGFRLRRYRPDGPPDPSPGVVVVPGSTGASAIAPTAALLPAHGCLAAVLS